MTALSTRSKKYVSSMVGAPILSGLATSLISVLDACLVTGFGITIASNLSISSGVGTLTYGLSHPFVIDSVVRVYGVSSQVDGDYRVLSSTANSITFDATGRLDIVISTPIQTKVAPAGWEKVYDAGSIAGYRSTNPLSTKMVLYVDDSQPQYAMVLGLESVGGLKFPSPSQYSTLYWSKSNSAGSAARPWIIIADDRGIFYFVKNGDTAAEYQSNYFGDLIPIRPNDPYACVLRANTANQSGNTTSNIGDDLAYATSASAYGGMYAPRPANGMGGAQPHFSDAVSSTGLALNWLVGGSGWTYPSPIDNSLVLTPVVVYNSQGYRGYFPGLRYSPQLVVNSFSTGDTINGSGQYAGEKVMAIRTLTLALPGLLFVNVANDWWA